MKAVNEGYLNALSSLYPLWSLHFNHHSLVANYVYTILLPLSRSLLRITSLLTSFTAEFYAVWINTFISNVWLLSYDNDIIRSGKLLRDSDLVHTNTTNEFYRLQRAEGEIHSYYLFRNLMLHQHIILTTSFLTKTFKSVDYYHISVSSDIQVHGLQ